MTPAVPARRLPLVALAAGLVLAGAAFRPPHRAALSPRFNHVMLTVASLDSSIAFYTKAFDLEVTQRIDSLTITRPDGSTATRPVKMAFLKFPGQEFVFELAERKVQDDGITPVFQHVGVDVKDIASAAERVKAAGGRDFSGIAMVEGKGVKCRNTFFKGPDGEHVELMEIVSGEF